MNAFPAHPSLYQVNTRVWLTGLSEFIGRPVTLDDIPDADLDRLAGMGFDRVWFLSVWQTGPAAQQGRVAMRDGTRISRKRYRTCAKKTSPAPGSPSRATPSIAIWAAPRRSHVCGSRCEGVD